MLAIVYYLDIFTFFDIYSLYEPCTLALERIIDFHLDIRDTPGFIVSTGRTLIICNHPTLLDSYAIIRWGLRHNLQHRISFIAADWLRYLPIPHPFRRKITTIKRDYSADKGFLTSFSKSLEKDAVVVIFPEGTTYYADALCASLDYADKQNLPRLRNLLYPRYKGIDILLQHNSWNQVIDLTLDYPERSMHPFMGSEGYHLIRNIYPHKCTVTAEDITHIALQKNTTVSSKEWLMQRWFAKNKLINCL